MAYRRAISRRPNRSSTWTRSRCWGRGGRDLGLHEKPAILVGVGPLRSAKAAEWMRSHVPGVAIPDEIIRRLRGAPSEREGEEGKRLCIEIIHRVRTTEG